METPQVSARDINTPSTISTEPGTPTGGQPLNAAAAQARQARLDQERQEEERRQQDGDGMAARPSVKRKRPSDPVSPPSAAQRVCGSGGGASPAAAAEPPTTLIDVEGDWTTALKEQREARQFIDITLVAGERRIEAHKVVIASASPYLNGLLTSGLAKSAAQSQELTLEDNVMDGRAVEAVVGCMYSGKLALSSHTVKAVIRAANLLQVGAVEKAAGEFLVSKLEPSTAADALAFAAERVECGEHAKKLLDDCVEYAIEHFSAVSREASFLSLPCETVASLIGSDELLVNEPDVVSAVRSWFEHDREERKAALPTLMPLVRWPLLPVEARQALSDEPLFEHFMVESCKLGMKMLLECGSPDPLNGIAASGCPRLKWRQGTGVAFGEFSAAHYQTRDGGALLEQRGTDEPRYRPARTSRVFNGGKHCVELTLSGQVDLMVGLARPTLDTSSLKPEYTDLFWGWYCARLDEFGTGYVVHNGVRRRWAGQQGFGGGDVLRLLLDCDAGTLTAKKNGTRLGTPVAEGLTGELCWAVALYSTGAVRITAVDPEKF